jgi:hypothetical protein
LSLFVLAGVANGHQAVDKQPAAAQPAKEDLTWAPLGFLVGEWTGEGSGDPGQGAGGFSFTWDLQQKVLVRRNFAEYPAAKDRPAFSHYDLMVVYKDPAGGRLKAIYFDSEGHVINYDVSASKDSNVIQFLSDASLTSPRYRFTYTKTGSAAVSIKFEIAPPGKGDSFSPYIQATARRK